MSRRSTASISTRKGISARTAFIIGKDGKIKDIVASDIPVARDIAALIDKARAA